MFAKYHYLSHSFNKAASVFIMTIDNNLCGFCAVLPFPHPIKKNIYKEHRTVILPDYQGIGLSKILRNFIAEYYIMQNKSFITTTSSPALINSMKNDKNWRCTRIGRASKGGSNGLIQNKNKDKSTSNDRITTSWEYVNN